jgi:hypothetical protein
MAINVPVEVDDREVKRNARGQFLAPPPGSAPPITSDSARDMVRLREEKRRRLYNIGAQRMVQDEALVQEFGEDAHLVERAMTLQQIATTPDAGKAAVMADSALQRAQGYDVKQDDNTQSQATEIIGALTELMRIASTINLHDTDAEVIDAD